jgi:hypothetical protein
MWSGQSAKIFERSCHENGINYTSKLENFAVLLTVHLSIILETDELNAQNLVL